MNKEQTQAAIAVMQAFVDGQIIENQCKHSGQWYVTAGPAWDFSRNDYRVKPKTIRYRRLIWDDMRVITLSENAPYQRTPNEMQYSPGFVRWIDTEWQEEIV